MRVGVNQISEAITDASNAQLFRWYKRNTNNALEYATWLNQMIFCLTPTELGIPGFQSNNAQVCTFRIEADVSLSELQKIEYNELDHQHTLVMHKKRHTKIHSASWGDGRSGYDEGSDIITMHFGSMMVNNGFRFPRGHENRTTFWLQCPDSEVSDLHNNGVIDYQNNGYQESVFPKKSVELYDKYYRNGIFTDRNHGDEYFKIRSITSVQWSLTSSIWAAVTLTGNAQVAQIDSMWYVPQTYDFFRSPFIDTGVDGEFTENDFSSFYDIVDQNDFTNADITVMNLVYNDRHGNFKRLNPDTDEYDDATMSDRRPSRYGIQMQLGGGGQWELASANTAEIDVIADANPYGDYDNEIERKWVCFSGVMPNNRQYPGGQQLDEMKENCFTSVTLERGVWGTSVDRFGYIAAVYQAGDASYTPRNYNAGTVHQFGKIVNMPADWLTNKLKYQLKVLYEFGNEQIFQDSSADPALIMPNLIQTNAVAGVF